MNCSVAPHTIRVNFYSRLSIRDHMAEITLYCTAIDILSPHGPNTYPASRADVSRHHTTVNHLIHADPHKAGYTTTPLLKKLDPSWDYPELCADQQVCAQFWVCAQACWYWHLRST